MSDESRHATETEAGRVPKKGGSEIGSWWLCVPLFLPLKTPSPGEVNLLQTYSPCYPKS